MMGAFRIGFLAVLGGLTGCALFGLVLLSTMFLFRLICDIIYKRECRCQKPL